MSRYFSHISGAGPIRSGQVPSAIGIPSPSGLRDRVSMKTSAGVRAGKLARHARFPARDLLGGIGFDGRTVSVPGDPGMSGNSGRSPARGGVGMSRLWAIGLAFALGTTGPAWAGHVHLGHSTPPSEPQIQSLLPDNPFYQQIMAEAPPRHHGGARAHALADGTLVDSSDVGDRKCR
jgi:hypothetical protein